MAKLATLGDQFATRYEGAASQGPCPALVTRQGTWRVLDEVREPAAGDGALGGLEGAEGWQPGG